ncbi:MAG: cupin domain-containing protein [Ekhidna sp.]|uniref:cupin domain-containing protein n=1 Tax=Ekhidna sp. TaxID=2608089 RepID=UPI0032EAB3AC
MKELIEPARVFTLKETVSYAEGAVVSKTISKSKSGNITLFAFDKGQGLSEHTAPFDAIAMIIEGYCKITIGGNEHHLEEGQMIIMPANIPHALEATKQFKMFLIMIKNKAED